MTDRLGGWAVVVAAGLVLGFLVISQWPPYHHHTPMVVPGWALTVFALLLGGLPAYLFEHASAGLCAEMVLIVVAVAVPVAASVATSFMLGTTALLDVILYSAIQRALGQSISLFVLVISGFALGLVIRLRIDRSVG